MKENFKNENKSKNLQKESANLILYCKKENVELWEEKNASKKMKEKH